MEVAPDVAGHLNDLEEDESGGLRTNDRLFDNVQRHSGYINLKIVIHNFGTTDEHKDIEIFARSLLEPKFCVSYTRVLEGKWIPKTLAAELILSVGQEKDFEKELNLLETEWFRKLTSDLNRHLWLETDHGQLDQDSLISARHRVAVCQISLGTFRSADKFQSHWCSEHYEYKESDSTFSSEYSDSESEDLVNQHIEKADISAEFEHDMRSLSIQHRDHGRQVWKLEIEYDRLERLVLMNIEESSHDLYFFVNSQPKVYKTVRRVSGRVNDVLDLEERAVQFGTCTKEVLGSSNVILLRISNRELNLRQVKSRLTKLGFSLLLGKPYVYHLGSESLDFPWPSFTRFEASFAWFCLLSRGFKVTDQLDENFLSVVNDFKKNQLIETVLYSVISIFDRSCICSLHEAFLNEKTKEEASGFEAKELHIPHLVKVRRVLVSPTTVQGLGEEWTVENRVLRQFGADRFIRIVIRDEDFRLLSPSVKLSGPVNAVSEFLSKGLRIENRHYKFLGCSNSQLRQHGAWMYASDGKNTVDSIRKWMGDLSDERCIAAYVSRLGQCFSSSRDSVEVNNVQRIPDIEYNKYCFTDGIGRISESLAKKVSDVLGFGQVPSAFQIRYGGSKGVVAIAPELENEEKLQLRESMVKFESKHSRLEVMQITRPGPLHLNRQIIVLMSGLKVPEESFFSLQETMLKKLADMLVIEDEAVKALCQSNLGMRDEALKNSGIVVTMEPFLRSVLMSIYEQRFTDLLRRTRIEIPPHKGRIMMGTVDETCTLEYGQVFVQYSDEINKQHGGKAVLTGSVVIAKNPCLHPGDLRKFHAVDIKALHHMVDCIVFPAKGARPHPDEMSGSDLDGDMYFVCWDESLIPPGDNQTPMDFTAQEKKCLDRPVTEDDMIRFIGNYIASDQVGVIANAHLVHADAKGIFCKECKTLAQLHSDAIDFPKTGRYLRIPSDLRPGSYPHYMMKHDKPLYTSSHVIAKLFDECQAVEQLNYQKRPLPVHVDNSLLVPGYEKYLESARLLQDFYDRQVNELMSTYGINSEAALLAATTFTLQPRKGYLKGDHFEIAEIVTLKLDSIKQRVETMFFEEFKGERNERPDTESAERDDEGSSNKEKRKNRKLEVLRKVSAVYVIAYNSCTKEMANKELKSNIGLPWIFWDFLLDIKTMAHTINTNRSCENQWKSFLHKISLEMAKVSSSIGSEFVDIRAKRLAMFGNLLQKLGHDNLPVVLFGSTITNFDMPISGLDIYVSGNMPFQTAVLQIAKSIGGTVTGSFLGNPKKSFATVVLGGDPNIKLYLYASKDCLNRTAYIVAAAVLNKSMLPAVKVALDWACKNNLVPVALKAEEFVLMFYYVALNLYKNGSVVSKEAQEEAIRLLEKNHFLNCPISQCNHIQNQFRDEDSTTELFADLSLCTNSNKHRTDKACNFPASKSLQAMHEDLTPKLGDILLQFYRHFGVVRGKMENSILDILDPSSAGGQLPLIRKKPQQCQQIVKKMMQAHHCLANSISIKEFLDVRYSANGPFSIVLPSQVSSSIRYRKENIVNKIRKDSGADIFNIREKKFRGDLRTCFILEAWGLPAALVKVREKVRDLVASSSMFVSDNYPKPRSSIMDAHHIVFEHCERPEARVVITPYSGPNQPYHDTFDKQVASLFHPGATDSYDLEHFVSLFNKQRNFITESYDKDLCGELRGVISYGTYYICNCTETEMTAKNFEDMMCKKREMGYSAHVSRMPQNQRQRGRNRGRYMNQYRPDRIQHVRGAFIPTESANIDNLEKLFKRHNFVLKKRRVEYRPTVKMSMPRQGGNTDGTLVLDEKFNFQSFILPDEKWLVLDVVRDKTGQNRQAKDIRFKIQSRPIRSDDELKQYPELKTIIRNTRNLLLTNQGGVVYGVSEDFKTRIRFLRQKDVHEFEYSGKGGSQESNEFLNKTTIRINFGTEYSRPGTTGIFSDVSTSRVEVTVVPKLPDLKDAEESEEFIRKVWQFSKEFGELLQCGRWN